MADATPAPPAASAAPIPMSFPAILRTGALEKFVAERLLPERGVAAGSPSARKRNREEKDGKRWIRRDMNARFVGNPHIVRPSRKDYSLNLPTVHPTFPEPLPAYLSRNAKILPSTIPPQQPMSASAGRFSLSLKGMRRTLRSSGPHTQQLVGDVEDAVMFWLHEGKISHLPNGPPEITFPGNMVGNQETIHEVSKTPLQLVWAIDDPWTRYVVHCCARYHEIVSFSKEISDRRVTYLLRPNVAQPDPRAPHKLDTPPVTDLSELSTHELDSESDFVSDRDTRSDAAPSDVEHMDRLSAIAESERSLSRPLSPVLAAGSEDEWSVIGGDDVEGDESASEHGLADSLQSLSLADDVDRTPRAVQSRQQALRREAWERRHRDASSPSRSPSRRTPRRPALRTRIDANKARRGAAKSFCEYLFE